MPCAFSILYGSMRYEARRVLVCEGNESIFQYPQRIEAVRSHVAHALANLFYGLFQYPQRIEAV